MRALLLDLGGTVVRCGSEMSGLLGEAEPAARAVAARRDDVIRPGAARLAAGAKAAGHPVGVLTNDLRAFHGETATTRARR